MNSQFEEKCEQRISRICWNLNSWQKPSGIEFKSEYESSYEHQYGYGHEEWLFDFNKIIDGYHYAYLQPVGRHRDNFTGRNFDIDLYSINSDERRSYWIAELKNAEVIDEKLEKIAIKIYEEKGWLEGMRKDLRDVEADVESFNEMIEQDELFNIRFRAQDAFVFDEPVSFADDEIISNTRYVFIRRENARREIEPSEELVSGTGEKEILDGKTQKRNQKTVECSQLHNQIQNSLLVYLSKAYPKDETQLEGRTNYATSVDLYRYAADGLRYFYEVKTYPSAKACIRAALGQLLEYAFYPDCKRADHLIIVSQAPLRENDRRYIKHLQSQFPFSLGYIQFDHDNGKIIEEL